MFGQIPRPASTNNTNLLFLVHSSPFRACSKWGYSSKPLPKWTNKPMHFTEKHPSFDKFHKMLSSLSTGTTASWIQDRNDSTNFNSNHEPFDQP